MIIGIAKLAWPNQLYLAYYGHSHNQLSFQHRFPTAIFAWLEIENELFTEELVRKSLSKCVNSTYWPILGLGQVHVKMIMGDGSDHLASQTSSEDS